MIVNKLKIKQVKPITENIELDANNWIIADGKIISYDFESRMVTEKELDKSESSSEEQKILAEIKSKREQERIKFLEKNQIRVGYHLLSEDGMQPIPCPEDIFFDTKTSLYLKKLFFNFFEKSSLLQNKFKRNKRAYLLYSDPGMGKSALIRNFCRHVLEQEGTAIVVVDGDVNFNFLSNIFLKPYAENVKRIVLIIEDFGKKDNGTNNFIYNPTCLNFLDGMSGLFRIPTMILCTTNFIRELGPHLTNRPGRFNRLINVLPPLDDEVFALVEGMGQITLSEEQKNAFRGKNLSPDHVIECIIRHELEEISLQEAVEEVIAERRGIV